VRTVGDGGRVCDGGGKKIEIKKMTEKFFAAKK
jgi:hypothetical protein